MNDSQVFVLQVWPHPRRFRAALRAVDEIEAVEFEALQPLCEHLAGIANAALADRPVSELPPSPLIDCQPKCEHRGLL